jgi:hypothetical protein
MSDELIQWKKSTFTTCNECVEVTVTEHTVHVRDSKQPQGLPLSLTRAEWNLLVTGIKAGEIS